MSFPSEPVLVYLLSLRRMNNEVHQNHKKTLKDQLCLLRFYTNRDIGESDFNCPCTQGMGEGAKEKVISFTERRKYSNKRRLR